MGADVDVALLALGGRRAETLEIVRANVGGLVDLDVAVGAVVPLRAEAL